MRSLPFALTRLTASGEPYTDEQRENLKALSGSASLLAKNLTQLQQDVSDGRITMDELESSRRRMEELEGSLPITVGESIRLIEQEFPETPSLIYDGPFSEHLTSSTPKMLDGQSDIDVNTGRKIAARFLGVKPGVVALSGESEGRIPSLFFSAQLDSGAVTVQLSRAGGKVINMLSARIPMESRVTDEDAIAAARRFLEMLFRPGQGQRRHGQLPGRGI